MTLPNWLIEPSGAETSYDYDSRGNLVRTLDAMGNEVEMRHDRLDRLLDTRPYLGTSGIDGTSSANIDVSTIAQSWDALSRVQTCTDDDGDVTAYDYDALGRRVGRT